MLKIENLTKYYLGSSGKLPVLENINLAVTEGEFLCIVGPSGCGKTTLLHIIAGIELDYAGKVLHKEEVVKKTSSERAMIFQDLGLFPWLNVQKNVEFGLKMKGIPAQERKNIALEYLDLVHLTKFKDSYIHELSAGMKQRVALARAWAMNPQILLMDEPFTALDAQTRDILHEELQKIWARSKKTIIFVTHNVREAVCLGDRVMVFSLAPARIKATFTVNLPRPRHIEDPGLIDKVRIILSELKFEIQKSKQKELDVKENNN
jgi:NitT/TauT family transport system ATP-binding protein